MPQCRPERRGAPRLSRFKKVAVGIAITLAQPAQHAAPRPAPRRAAGAPNAVCARARGARQRCRERAIAQARGGAGSVQVQGIPGPSRLALSTPASLPSFLVLASACLRRAGRPMGVFTASRVQSARGGRLTPHFLCPQAEFKYIYGDTDTGPSAPRDSFLSFSLDLRKTLSYLHKTRSSPGICHHSASAVPGAERVLRKLRVAQTERESVSLMNPATEQQLEVPGPACVCLSVRPLTSS